MFWKFHFNTQARGVRHRRKRLHQNNCRAQKPPKSIPKYWPSANSSMGPARWTNSSAKELARCCKRPSKPKSMNSSWPMWIVSMSRDGDGLFVTDIFPHGTSRPGWSFDCRPAAHPGQLAGKGRTRPVRLIDPFPLSIFVEAQRSRNRFPGCISRGSPRVISMRRCRPCWGKMRQI